MRANLFDGCDCAGNAIDSHEVRNADWIKRIACLFIITLSFYAPCSHAQISKQIQCDDAFGVRYVVFNSPHYGGALAIAPLNMAGAELPLAILSDNPAVAMAYVEPNGFGVLISRDGGFVIMQNGQYFPTGRCAVVLTGFGVPPVPPGGLLAPPNPPPITNSHGTDVASLAPYGDSLTGHWPMYTTESQALSCKPHLEDGGDQDAFVSCMTTQMMTEKQAAAVNCLGEDDDVGKASCIAKIAFPGSRDAINIVQECADDSSVDLDCVAHHELSDGQYQAYKCAANAGSKEDASSCIAALGVDERTASTLSAISDCASGDDDAAIATCALSKSGDKRVATAAHCVSEQLDSGDFSYMGAAVCYGAGGLNLNPELQIAVECAAESDGDPLSFAGCTGGRLTVRELTKCFTQGVGGSGCFGPNNDVVKTLHAFGIDTSNLTNPNGELVKAWNTVTNDVEHGVGPNNDLVRFVTQQNFASFGPNNDLVRNFNNIGHDILYGPGPNNDFVKALNDAGQGVQQGGDQAKTYLNRTFGLHL